MHISRRNLIKAAPVAVGSTVLASSVAGGFFLARPAQANEEFIDKQLSESALVPDIDPEHGDMFVSTLRTFNSNGHLESGHASFYLPSLNSNGNRTLAYYCHYETLDDSYFTYSGNVDGESFEYDFPIEEYEENPFHRRLTSRNTIPLMGTNFGQFDRLLNWRVTSWAQRCGPVQYRRAQNSVNPSQIGLVADLWYPNMYSSNFGEWVRYTARFPANSSTNIDSARQKIERKAQAISNNYSKIEANAATDARGALLSAEVLAASGHQALAQPVPRDQVPMVRQYKAALATNLSPNDLERFDINRHLFDEIRMLFRTECIAGSFEAFDPFQSQNPGVSADGVYIP